MRIPTPRRTRVDIATAAAVLAAAAARGTWRPVDGGLEAIVGRDGYGWTVALVPAGTDRKGRAIPAQARITHRQGLGGCEPVDVRATGEQAAAIVASLAAGERPASARGLLPGQRRAGLVAENMA
ncbi:hypothetical protein [Streptomyces sp. NRRL S-350]|uniref:hypothetical protein n=1 Tax=Streptomyces sp. NRRL S-350 TaxID=1463902 RepID=UPI000689738D|nr:hypothetical protein [Streptomyces sp. NRRL S-350]